MSSDSELSQLWKYFPVIYLIGGMFCNYYLFASIVQKTSRSENIFIFFLVMVIADALVLMLSLVNEWLKETVNLDIRTLTASGCRVHMLISEAAMDIPPWVLVSMAYEKRALLWYPVPADSQFSRKTVKQVMAALAVFSLLRHQHFTWGSIYNTLDIIEYNNITNATNSSVFHGYTNICDVTNDPFGTYLSMYIPWVNLMVRMMAPCACLVAYNLLIMHKIYREKLCAERLMEKVGIEPPDWFYTGILHLERAVKWTTSLTFLICVNNLAYSLFYVMQPVSFGEQVTPYRPALRLAGSLLFYFNYSFIFPAFAVQDNNLLVIMRHSWGLPLVRKRGTNTASRPPDFIPERSLTSLMQKAYNRITGGYPSYAVDTVSPAEEPAPPVHREHRDSLFVPY